MGGRGRGPARDAEQADLLGGETYFHGSLPRENVDGILLFDGEFLVRYNDKDANRGFVISVRWATRIRHFKINQHNDGTFFIRKDKSFRSVKDVVDYHLRNSAPLVEKDCKDGLMKIEKAAPRSRWELKSADIDLLNKIGQGAFGEVWKAKFHRTKVDQKNDGTQRTSAPDKTSGMDVAVKTCKDKTRDGRNKFEKECMFQLKFKHKNIVATIGIVTSEEPMMIVLEFLPKGSLLSHLQKKKKELVVAKLKSFSVDAARGMSYLEQLKCIHRDVASRNCLVGANDEVKISDFGLAKSQEKYKMLVGKVAIKWMAPESMRLGDFTAKSDVWAFGVLMWEVFSFGAEPYPGVRGDQVKRKVLVEKVKMPPPPNTPPLFADMMHKCWEQAPRDRPSFAQIVAKLEGSVSGPSAPTARQSSEAQLPVNPESIAA